ncbi:MAG TPA: histidine phosphatase family protein [Gaiellaceae bacterium]|nr:histidine phosphatase family protein [Gaiellaceae bacterium]
MTTIVLARHGETDWNRERRFQGHADVPLNELGRRQARELAESLRGQELAAIYSSPLARARETAEAVAAVVGVPVETRPALREVDVGSWQGLAWDELERDFPDDLERWRAGGRGWTGGESYEELQARVVPELLELARRHPGERVLVVCHGGTMRAAQAAANQLSYVDARQTSGPIGNASVLVLRVEDGELRAVDSAI